jgi:hypothetical protein
MIEPFCTIRIPRGRKAYVRIAQLRRVCKKDNDKKANWLLAPVAGLPVPEILSGAHKDPKI